MSTQNTSISPFEVTHADLGLRAYDLMSKAKSPNADTDPSRESVWCRLRETILEHIQQHFSQRSPSRSRLDRFPTCHKREASSSPADSLSADFTIRRLVRPGETEVIVLGMSAGNALD